jgi:hypothetical protein
LGEGGGRDGGLLAPLAKRTVIISRRGETQLVEPVVWMSTPITKLNTNSPRLHSWVENKYKNETIHREHAQEWL